MQYIDPTSAHSKYGAMLVFSSFEQLKIYKQLTLQNGPGKEPAQLSCGNGKRREDCGCTKDFWLRVFSLCIANYLFHSIKQLQIWLYH